MLLFGRTPWSGQRFLVAFCLAQLCAAALMAQGGDPMAVLAEADRLAWLKEWTPAEPLFARAEQMFAARGDRRDELYARISKLRGELPELANADVSSTLNDLLLDPLLQRDQRLRLRCLVVKGDTDLDMDASLAERDWTEALSVAKALGDKGWEARATGELGIIAFLKGDSSTALMKMGTALAAAQAYHDVGAEIRYFTLFGDGFTEFGRAEQALVYFDRALAVAHAEKGVHEPMLTYTGKATALLALGRRAEAKELLEHTLEIARETNSLGYQAEVLTQLAQLAIRSGNSGEAKLRFEDATRLARQADAWRDVSLADFELSKIYEASGYLESAERIARESVAECRRVSDRYFLPRYLANEADIQVKRGRIREARATYDEAEDLINGVLVNASSVWTKSSLIAVMNEVFLGHFRLEAQYSQSATRAFRIVEEARGRAIADILRTRPHDKTPQPAALTADERSITLLQIELQKTTGRRERQRILDRLFEIEQSMAPLTTSANRWMRIAVRPVQLEDLQRVLQPNEILLEYVLDDPNSYCLVISRSTARIRKLAARDDIDRSVAGLMKNVQGEGDAKDPAGRLYRLVLAPMAQDFRDKARMIIVPDGSLHQVPFDLLSDEGGSILLRTHTVSYAPSGSVLTLLRTRKPAEVTRFPLLAVSASPPETRAVVTTSNAGKPFGSIVRGVYDEEKTDLPPLPEANGEVRDIAGILGNHSVVLINATEAEVKAQPLGEFAALHFAVHGLTSTKFPERSALIVRSDEAHHEDGLLQAREIMAMRLNADMVTLSACDTGSGRIAGEEGVASLARPFLVAGARSVIANLWSANDDFSRTLMKNFYTRLAAGEDEGSALRTAKLEMIELFGDRATPYLWAGFVAVGDGAAKLSQIR